MLFALAWRNLWRQRTRTILSLVSIAFAGALLVFMLSMQLGTYETMKTNTLRVLDGFVQIQPEGYADDPEVAKYFDGTEALLARIEQVTGVTAATPRGSSFVILAKGDTSFGAALVAVDPAREPKVTTLPSTVRKGRYLRPDDTDAIVLGEVLARNMGVSVGDRVTLLGSAADRSVAADSLKVVGLFSTGLIQLDRQFAQMPLSRFRETFFMPGGANVIAIAGKRLRDVNRALPALREIAAEKGLVVRDWAELQPALKQAITLDASSSSTVYVSLVIMVVFIILNTLYMSVLERTREFGMMLAIGMRPAPLGLMMWIELLLLAGLGSLIAIALGSVVVLWFQTYGIPMGSIEHLLARFGLPPRIYPQLSLLSATAGPLAISISIAIGGVVPFLRIRRLRPVDAMGAV